MTTTDVEHAGGRRGRSARQAERLARGLESVPYLTRKLDPVQVISTEGLETIEHNADTLLEEVGIEIVNYPEAVEIFRSAGADADGTRVRFPRGLCRSLINATAPRIFTQRARNEARSASSSAIRTWSSCRPTARRSSTTWTTAGATRRSRTSATS